MAVTQARDKYYLRSLHEEIDLFDRKLAHMLKYDSFATDAERKAAAGKMTAKRDQLARTARQLAEEGIEFKPSELPRSFRPEGAPTTASAPAKAVTEDVVLASANASDRAAVGPFDSSVLNFRNEIEEYIRNRKKA